MQSSEPDAVYKSIAFAEAVERSGITQAAVSGQMNLDRLERLRTRQLRRRPAADLLHVWLAGNRQACLTAAQKPKSSPTALKRWAAMTRSMDTGDLAVANDGI